MKRVSRVPSQTEIESLFALERVLVPEPSAFRDRAGARARNTLATALPTSLRLSLAHRPPRPALLGRVVAAAVILSTLCAFAFYAGYRVKERESVSVAGAGTGQLSPSASTDSGRLTTPKPAASTEVPHALSSSETPPAKRRDSALATRASAPSEATRASAPNETKPDRSGAVAEGEGYALELQVLQPAQQAVAQQDFSSALTAIGEHQRRFPSGRLTEEREALRIRALLGLGRRADAQRAGTAFRQRFPRSALLGRIDAMLGTPQ